jgi:predicted transport protein
MHYSNRAIYHKETLYYRRPYRLEAELEELAVQCKDVLFGKDALYLDIKTMITSLAKNSRKPDGYLITRTNTSDAMLWIVEYELSHHDVGSHVSGQLHGFIKAMENEVTKKNLRDAIFNEIDRNPDYRKKIEAIMSPSFNDSVRYFIEKIIERRFGLIVVIDRRLPELQEEVENISESRKVESRILEFITFENKEKGKEDIVFLMDTLDQSNMIESPSIQRAMERGNEDYHLQKCDEATKNLYNLIEDGIRRLDAGIVKKPRPDYIGFWKNNRIFSAIRIRRSKLTVALKVRPDSINDARVKRHYDREDMSQIDVTNSDDVSYALELLKQAYNSTEER